jgi:hypothetical protein
MILTIAPAAEGKLQKSMFAFNINITHLELGDLPGPKTSSQTGHTIASSNFVEIE